MNQFEIVTLTMRVVIVVAIGLIASCSHTSPTQYITTVGNEDSLHVRDILVVPVVKKYKALGVGSDSSGVEGERICSVGKPFLWNSGDELLPSNLKSSGVMLLPMVVARNDILVEKWLLLKRGYMPLVVLNGEGNLYRSGGHYGLLSPSDNQNSAPRMISPTEIRKEAHLSMAWVGS